MPAGCAPVSCPGRVQRGEAERNESRDPAQRLAQSNMADGCDPRVAPRSTQVGFTRLASSNCRSRASPRSVSRCARPGHESGARARRVRSRGSRMSRWPSSHLTMSNSAVLFVPAVRCCARVLVFSFRVHPPTRGGRSADRRTYSVVAFARRDGSARVRRGASHDAGRSPLGAPPWRFSAGGRASISGIASGSVQRAPRSQVIMPGGRCPGQPEQRPGTSGDNR